MKAMVRWLGDFFSKLNHHYHALLSHQQVKYRILELSLATQEVTLFVRRKSLKLKYPFAEVMNSLWMIEGLSPSHACWFGLFYGMSLGATGATKKKSKFIFLLKESKSRYKIIFQDRKGQIGYLDHKTKAEYVEHPLAMARNKYVIEKFSTTQACYIGILAGMSIEKSQQKDLENETSNVIDLFSKKTQLRIVS